MKSNFQAALAAALVSEGGFVNNKHDPGGATNRGIIQVVYDAWRKAQGLPARSVRLIEPDEVAAIYRRQYWDEVHGDDLPAGIDYVVFDYGINSGISRAKRELQAALGLKADGVIGVLTLAAAARADAPALINKICDDRLSFLGHLKNWRWFGKGWRRRVNDVRRRARLMAAGVSVASAPAPAAAKGPALLGKPAAAFSFLKPLIKRAA